jgi:hypothetical protein
MLRSKGGRPTIDAADTSAAIHEWIKHQAHKLVHQLKRGLLCAGSDLEWTRFPRTQATLERDRTSL